LAGLQLETCREDPTVPGSGLVEEGVAEMMYSPGSMNGGQGADAGRLEERVAELEELVEELEGVPGSEVVGILDRAVALLAEINADIEAGLISAEGEARELGDLLERVDFGSFDATLEDLERPSGGAGGG
jgi:hypothetical protein